MPSVVTADVRGIAVGDTLCVAERLDGDETKKDDLVNARERLSRRLRAIVHNIKLRHDSSSQYTIDTGEHRTHSRDILVFAAITRTA